MAPPWLACLARITEHKGLKKLEQAWDRIPTNNEKGDLRSDPEMEKFAEWLEKGDQGVLGQTILEEDDSDDLDGF